MCGIAGLTNYNNKCNYERFLSAVNLLRKRGPDEYGFSFGEKHSLGHQRLTIIDEKNGKQPMIFGEYQMVYNGELYNTAKLREELIELGHIFTGYSDTEVVLKSYIEWKEKCLDKLDGIFSFIVFDKSKMFFARDRLGVKPLFYSVKNGDIMLASEIKSILHYFDLKTVNKDGLKELLAMGPSNSLGKTIYENVFELKAGNYGIFDGSLSINEYWDLKPKNYNLSYEETVKKTRELVEAAIKKQLISDYDVGSFLSGGLDSSIIASVMANDDLCSFSVDYEENTFKKNKFQSSIDEEYIHYITDRYNISHKSYIARIDELIKNLEEAMILRDGPGMGDIDVSLLLLSREIKKTHKVALSGECADEIFGGYPWYYREDGNSTGFPWLRNLEFRESLLKEEIKTKLNLKEYVLDEYECTTGKLDVTDHQKMMYLNVKYFMQQLLTRKDRMTMGASLEVRVPYADHYLIEFLYNVPWEYKYNGIEKSLLRDAFRDVLPREILERKKTPYPKSNNRKYEEELINLVRDVFKRESLVNSIFDEEAIIRYIEKEEEDIPWYGQLMAKSQLLAYIYQIHLWGKNYNIVLDI